jgi:hypothetical protein
MEIRKGLLRMEDLRKFPASLEGRHATATWLACHQHLLSKRQHQQ